MEAVLFTKQDQERLAQIEKDVRSLKNKEIPEILVSQTEAARYLGVTIQTVFRYVRQNRLKKRTLGGTTGILLSDLIQFTKRK